MSEMDEDEQADYEAKRIVKGVSDYEVLYSELLGKVKRLAKRLAENRSDISDILYDIAEGKPLKEEDVEGRYIQAEIPVSKVQGDRSGNILVFYDTLTTLLEYFDAYDNKWKTCEYHKYEDD